MTKEDYLNLFTTGKDDMRLDQAADRIHELLVDVYPMVSKFGWSNREVYTRRLAVRTACMELEDAIRNAPPWEDYRRIIADFEWPYMRRVATHSMEDIYHTDPYGDKIGKADAWFTEMWVAYHTIYLNMPGTIPDTRAWQMHERLMIFVLEKTEKYRRKL